MNDSGFLGTEFREYLKAIKEYFNTGKVPSNHSSGHGLGVGMPNDTLSRFENKDKILDFVENFARTTFNIEESIFDIQRKFVYDPDVNYPYVDSLPFDLDTWEKRDTKYSIENERTEDERYNLFVIKRKYLTKNTMVKL
jgi:hypothetical protein